jgi:muramoyltetrapeptide carboxypeptidase
LAPGDVVGVAAPSGIVDREAFASGLAVLEGLGYRIVVSPGVYTRSRFFAGDDAARAEAFNALFADPAIGAIVCARGGYGAMRILPNLDFDLIAQNPKAIIGFSDITALLWSIYSRCGFAVYHGPNVVSLNRVSPLDLRFFAGAVAGASLPPVVSSNPVVIYPGRAEGPVAGGNLCTLCHLVGTPFAPRFADRLLFLEDRGELPYRIDRMLAQLRFSGALAGVKGVLLGSFHDCGEPEAVHEVFADAFGRDRIPVAAGFPIGHGSENRTIPLGLSAVLDAGRGVLTYLEAGEAESKKGKPGEKFTDR